MNIRADQSYPYFHKERRQLPGVEFLPYTASYLELIVFFALLPHPLGFNNSGALQARHKPFSQIGITFRSLKKFEGR